MNHTDRERKVTSRRITMHDIFDAMHRGMFDQLFSLDDEGRKAKAQLLREAGIPEEMIPELTRPGIQPGMAFGGAKTVDVMNVVERVLFRQNAGSVLLRVKRPPFDEAGHIEIEVLEIGPPSEEQHQGRTDGQ
jgi:hypothetical protein